MPLNVMSPNKFVPTASMKEEARLAFIASGQADNPYTPGHWSQSYIIRTVIGMLVTAGATISLLKMAELVVLWITPIDAFWKGVAGFIVWQSVQMVGVFLGGMMVAAGQNQTLTLGLLLGIMVGFLTLIVFPTNPNVPQALYFAMPAWFTVSGAFGAWVGELLWHPMHRKSLRLVSNAKLTPESKDLGFGQVVRNAVLGMIFANIHWLRVILAVILIIPTLWGASAFVNFLIMKLGLGAWVLEVGLQKLWVATMIKIGMVVLCAAMVGAGTTHGIAHGFWTGVICGVANLLLHVFIPREEVLPVDQILWEVAWVFGLCVIAGGFGALAIPPMMYLAQKRRPVSLR